MKFFSLISKKEVLPEPGEKVISAKDFSELKKSQEILKQVKQEEKEYKISVSKECEQLKKIAYEEGFNEGLLKLNKIIVKLSHELEHFKEEIKNKILPIVLQAAKKILGQELDLKPEKIVNIVEQAIKPAVQHHDIKIFVNKEDFDILEKNKDRIQKILKQVKSFSIHPRDNIEKGGCMIETEAGIINAQLENQWQALERALEGIIKEKI